MNNEEIKNNLILRKSHFKSIVKIVANYFRNEQISKTNDKNLQRAQKLNIKMTK